MSIKAAKQEFECKHREKHPLYQVIKPTVGSPRTSIKLPQRSQLSSKLNSRNFEGESRQTFLDHTTSILAHEKDTILGVEEKTSFGSKRKNPNVSSTKSIGLKALKNPKEPKTMCHLFTSKSSKNVGSPQNVYNNSETKTQLNHWNSQGSLRALEIGDQEEAHDAILIRHGNFNPTELGPISRNSNSHKTLPFVPSNYNTKANSSKQGLSSQEESVGPINIKQSLGQITSTLNDVPKSTRHSLFQRKSKLTSREKNPLGSLFSLNALLSPKEYMSNNVLSSYRQDNMVGSEDIGSKDSYSDLCIKSLESVRKPSKMPLQYENISPVFEFHKKAKNQVSFSKSSFIDEHGTSSPKTINQHESFASKFSKNNSSLNKESSLTSPKTIDIKSPLNNKTPSNFDGKIPRKIKIIRNPNKNLSPKSKFTLEFQPIKVESSRVKYSLVASKLTERMGTEYSK